MSGEGGWEGREEVRGGEGRGGEGRGGRHTHDHRNCSHMWYIITVFSSMDRSTIRSTTLGPVLVKTDQSVSLMTTHSALYTDSSFTPSRLESFISERRLTPC